MRCLTWRTGVVLVIVAAFTVAAVAFHDGTPDTVSGGRPLEVLAAFPGAPEAYTADAAALVRAGIPTRYGEEEWAAIVMTHEFHQHVGIYTLLGAKMAVQARQLLGAPMRAVQVVSATGRRQPLACMNDGIQAAIGSTLGQNLIDVPETETPRVAATFTYNGRTIRLSLEDAYAARLATIIREAREAHGDLTPAYFKAVEKASFIVWAEFDRRAVFKVEEVMKPVS